MLKIGRECQNVTHIKESSGEIRKVRDLARQGKGDFEVFCGAGRACHGIIFRWCNRLDFRCGEHCTKASD